MAVSRQRLWQKKQNANGKCALCAKPIWRYNSKYCKDHALAARAVYRKNAGHRERLMRGVGRPTNEKLLKFLNGKLAMLGAEREYVLKRNERRINRINEKIDDILERIAEAKRRFGGKK